MAIIRFVIQHEPRQAKKRKTSSIKKNIRQEKGEETKRAIEQERQDRQERQETGERKEERTHLRPQ
jgi:hypothetical protein